MYRRVVCEGVGGRGREGKEKTKNTSVEKR